MSLRVGESMRIYAGARETRKGTTYCRRKIGKMRKKKRREQLPRSSKVSITGDKKEEPGKKTGATLETGEKILSEGYWEKREERINISSKRDDHADEAMKSRRGATHCNFGRSLDPWKQGGSGADTHLEKKRGAQAHTAHLFATKNSEVRNRKYVSNMRLRRANH